VSPGPPIPEKLVLEDGICNTPGDTRLIDIAVAAGNVPNVMYLLSRGADPNGVVGQPSRANYPKTVFSRCLKLNQLAFDARLVKAPAEIPTHLILAAYDVLLRSGGRLDIYDRRGFGPLHFCGDSTLVEYFLKRGADVNANNPLETHVSRILQSDYSSNRDESLEIARMLASKAASRRVSRGTEYFVCVACSGVKLANECRAFSEFVEVSDTRIFTSKDEALSANSRSHRCSLMTDPAGPLNAELRKLYDLERDRPILAPSK
jgi:hypothetical protein